MYSERYPESVFSKFQFWVLKYQINHQNYEWNNVPEN